MAYEEFKAPDGSMLFDFGDPDPEWFERLKSFAGNSVRNFMKIGGPWDM